MRRRYSRGPKRKSVSTSLKALNGEKPIAYYWARVATSSNPSCKATVPLLKGFYLCNKDNKKVYLQPQIKGKKISFTIEREVCEEEGWLKRANLTCPICGSVTKDKDLKKQFKEGTASEKILAVIEEGNGGKNYRQPSKEEIDIFEKIPKVVDRPTEEMPVKYTQAFPSCTWGISTWCQLFSPRQLLALQTFVEEMKTIQASFFPDGVPQTNEREYDKAELTYLGILVDRVAALNTKFGVWHLVGEKVERIMGRQNIPMVFDFPKGNPLEKSNVCLSNSISWVLKVIEAESNFPFEANCNNSSSGDVKQFLSKELTAVVTDPPYYDAIAYADLLDFF